MLNFYAALPLIVAAAAAPISDNTPLTLGIAVVFGGAALVVTWRAAVITTRIENRLTSVEETNVRIEAVLDKLPCKGDHAKEAVCERE